MNAAKKLFLLSILVFVQDVSLYSCEESKSADISKIVDLTPIDSSMLLNPEKIKKPINPLGFKSVAEYERAIEDILAVDRDGKFLDFVSSKGCRFSMVEGQVKFDPIFYKPYDDSLCGNMWMLFEYDEKNCERHGHHERNCFQRWAYASYLLQPKHERGPRVFMGDFGADKLKEDQAIRALDAETSRDEKVIAERSDWYKKRVSYNTNLMHVLIESYGRREVLRRIAPVSTKTQPINIVRKLQNRSLGVKPETSPLVKQGLK